MVFSSETFLFLFLAIVYIAYLIIKNLKARNIILIITSMLFYAYGEPVAVVLMIVSIIFNYIFGRLMASERHRKKLLVISIIFNIGMLFVFKYLTYTLSLFNSIFQLPISIPDIALPIGISFFTFQAMSYVIDAYKDNSCIRKNILDIFLYISFFPQLIAGPIIKFNDIAAQIENRSIDAEKSVEGIKRFICGLAKKLLIANTMGAVADAAFACDISNMNFIAAWIGALSYVLQIYFDFSGYSDMAIGLGKMFGFEFKENFNYPLAANGMTDFWRKWNISVSSWFKEYVYIPLGGNRKGKARMVLNKIIVFLLTGIWHGANLTFVLWGIIHGTFLMLESYHVIPQKLFKKKLLSPIMHIYTILIITLTFVIFRADNISQGFCYIGAMFSGFEFSAASSFAKIISMLSPYYIIMFVIGAFVSTPIMHNIKTKMLSCGKASLYYSGTAAASLVLFILCLMALSTATYNPFIYFRF